MTRGGKRENAGRKMIEGKEYKIKIEDEKIEQIEMKFLGNSLNDKIRECIDQGLKNNENLNINENKNLTVVDLFSGAGGLSRGFLDAGYNVVLGVDADEMALKTFKENHGKTCAMKIDLFDHNNISIIEEKLKELNVKLDVLVGGPPCQGFSLAGSRKEDDARNTLYTAMVKTAKLLKPKAVVLENVPGLLTLYNGIAAKSIHKDFTELGYTVRHKVLYAPEYGIPQIRKRVFFVCLLNSEIKEEFEFPNPILSEEHFVTCEDAISDLPSLEGVNGEIEQDYEIEAFTDYQRKMRKNSLKIYNHMGTKHSEKTVKLIAMVPEGKNYKALPEEYRSQFNFNEALTRYHSKKPSRTIDTGHRTHFHYKYNRIPTVRENARLQSFPDDFIFYGNKAQQYKQVGNAVPPMLGYHLALKLKDYLK